MKWRDGCHKISTVGVKFDSGFLSLRFVSIFLMFYCVLNEVRSITFNVSICLWPASDTASCTDYTPCFRMYVFVKFM